MSKSFRAVLRAVALPFALLLVTGQPSFAHDYKIGDLELQHPWSRETPQGAKVAAGYVKIVNHGSEADRLIGVTGAIAGRGEVHEMLVDDKGVMTMRPVTGGVEIPAGGEVELKPGAFHIMFLDLTDAKKKGERFAGSLTFEKAGTVDVEFAVDAIGGGKASDAKADDHSGHGTHGG